MTITPKSGRAKSRFNDHDLTVVREGIFSNSPAILMTCTDANCPNIRKDGSPWMGWFTKNNEVAVS